MILFGSQFRVLFFHGKAVTCLQYGTTGNVVISGSEDGLVRVWDARTYSIIQVLRHAKGPVNNIVLVREQLNNFQRTSNSQAFLRRHASLLPPLEKYANSTDEVTETKTVISFQETCNKSINAVYLKSIVAHNQIKELERQGSAAVEMEMDRVKLDCKKSMQTVQQWNKMYENLHQFCVDELLEDGGPKSETLCELHLSFLPILLQGG